ncbi:MAG: AraC family transcriptional regulator, partial [Spirochaetales bacterium]|nr:AraC family transcriptional regulator [Spirochaetales bacterium]
SAYVSTSLPGVRFFWSTERVERAPLIYNAGLVVVLQGHKVGYLGEREFHYNPDQYLLLSVPVPFECETRASLDDPLFGLFLDIDRTDLHELVGILDGEGRLDRPLRGAGTVESSPFSGTGVVPARMNDGMRGAVNRLLDALCSPAASLALGKGILREIYFHALDGVHGEAMRALAREDSHDERISRAISLIRNRFAADLSVDDLADEAGMSPSVFHRAFKGITGSSPHQYLKTTRLHRAKGLIIGEGLPVNEAARLVGYENPAHFSREFKRHFRVSPRDAKDSAYRAVDV